MTSVRFRLRSLFRRHHKLIPVIAAVIIFFTFVIREEVGDHWRATAEQIDHAQELYASRIETQEIRRTLAEEQGTLDQLYSMAKGYQLSYLKNVTHQSTITLKSIETSLTDIDFLLTRMNNTLNEQNQVNKFREELKKGKREESNLETLINTRSADADVGPMEWVYEGQYKKGPLDAFLPDTVDNTLASHVQNYRIASGDLEYDVTNLNNRVLERAEQLRRTNERRSSYASVLAFTLFVLGSAIGVVAKIYGVEIEDDDGGD